MSQEDIKEEVNQEEIMTEDEELVSDSVEATDKTESGQTEIDIDQEEADLDPIQVLEEEKEALEDRVLRLQAEINNIQKRNARDRSIAAKYQSQKLASQLLDVVDNLERALATPTQSEDAQALKQGVEMVYKQFLNAFEQEKIIMLDPLGQEFDPNLHQAVSMMPADEGQASNTVIQVLQKGYQLEDRIIRPAMVIVAE